MRKEFSKPYFSKLDSYLVKEAATKKIFPPRDQVFSAFGACSFEDIKVRGAISIFYSHAHSPHTSLSDTCVCR